MAVETRIGYAERSFIALREAKEIANRSRSQLVPLGRIMLLVGEAIVYSMSDLAEQVDEGRRSLTRIEAALEKWEQRAHKPF